MMALRRKFVASVIPQQCEQMLRAYSTGRDQNKGTNRSQGRVCAGSSAYEVLGLPESCSNASIRATFRKLAKATHPDLQTDTSTDHFVRILAAYEILSDPTKRAEYDQHLKSKRGSQQTHNVSKTQTASGYGDGVSGGFNSNETYQQEPPANSTEVVSWLRSYRAMIRSVLHGREIGAGTGWEEELRGETHSALQKAYFGPPVSEHRGVPECFEAEERAEPGIQDVLHLVSGRQLFGLVHQIQDSLLEGSQEGPFLLQPHTLEKHSGSFIPDRSCNRNDVTSCEDDSVLNRQPLSAKIDELGFEVHRAEGTAYADLELQLFGKVVARSIRVPLKCDGDAKSSVSENGEEHDCIYIYLSSEQVDDAIGPSKESVADKNKFSRTLLGTIRGLRSMGAGSTCFAHGPDGKRTHLILRHRTPLVKHMQWFRIGEESAHCECRCRRASALPSRYWLFEPRTDTHNVGGWYIEAFDQSRRFGRSENRGRGSSREPRHRNGGFIRPPEEESGKIQDLLHPAMYIMAVAYNTLDEEDHAAQRKETSLSNRIRKFVSVPGVASDFVKIFKK